MIKVLHSELQGYIGGIESFFLNLTESMDMTDIHFDVLMYGDNEYLERKLRNLGVTIFKVPTSPVKYYSFIKQLLQKNNYDFVHVHKNSAANIILPEMVKRYSKAKLIVHSHNTNPSGGSQLAVILHKLNKNKLIKLSDYRLACSDTAAEWMFGKKYNNRNVTIIKNGIITRDYIYNPEIRNQTRKKLGLDGKFVIGHVGAFREQKNHNFLINMFSKLNIPNAELVLVGNGPLKVNIEQQVKDLNIADKVKFLGSRNDVNDILQAFDVFVMPSLWEGLSVSTIEAQASGLPLVLSAQVSRLTKVTPNVSFLSLDNLNQWIKKINELKDEFKRTDESEFIKKAGYDMSSSAKEIKKIYLNILQ